MVAVAGDAVRCDALLFRQGPPTKFNLVDTKPLKSGIVILSYQPECTDARPG